MRKTNAESRKNLAPSFNNTFEKQEQNKFLQSYIII